MMDDKTSAGIRPMTFQEAVEGWADEREKLRYVQAYTARRSRQKALLFEPWIGGKAVDEVAPADILLGHGDPLRTYLFQGAWAVVLLGAGRLLQSAATRRVVVQGG